MLTEVKLPNIFYELVIETTDGKTVSEFFLGTCIITSRHQAIDRFLTLTLDEGLRTEEQFLSLWVRHVRSSERAELITSATYGNALENLRGLARETSFYVWENIAVHFAAFDVSRPTSVSIFFPTRKGVRKWKRADVYLFLASQYWVFCGQIKRKMLYQ